MVLAAALTPPSQSSTCEHTCDLFLYSSLLLSFSFLLLFFYQTSFGYLDLVLPSLQIDLWVIQYIGDYNGDSQEGS